jgi:hypothetical protein
MKKYSTTKYGFFRSYEVPGGAPADVALGQLRTGQTSQRPLERPEVHLARIGRNSERYDQTDNIEAVIHACVLQWEPS